MEHAAEQHPQVPFFRALVSQSVPVPGIALSQVQHPAFSFVELHGAADRPALQIMSAILQQILDVK